MNINEVKNEFLNQYLMSSMHTREKYQKDIDLFLFLTKIETTEQLNEFSISQMNLFYDYAKSKQWSANTINQRLVVVKIFTKWCFENGYIDKNYLARTKLIKTHNEVHFTPKFEDCEKLLNYINAHTKQKRLYLMTKLLINTALRRSEICGLKIDDIDEIDSSIKVVGKGKKIIKQPVPANIIKELKDYIATERKTIMNKYSALKGKDLGYLFVSGIGENCNQAKKNLNNGNKVDSNSFCSQIKRYAKLANIDNAEKFTLHCIRRASGTNIYECTGDLKLTSEYLRHSSTSITERHYISFNRERLVNVVNERFAQKAE